MVPLVVMLVSSGAGSGFGSVGSVVMMITVVIVSGSGFGSVDSGYDDHSGGSFW